MGVVPRVPCVQVNEVLTWWIVLVVREIGISGDVEDGYERMGLGVRSCWLKLKSRKFISSGVGKTSEGLIDPTCVSRSSDNSAHTYVDERSKRQYPPKPL